MCHFSDKSCYPKQLLSSSGLVHLAPTTLPRTDKTCPPSASVNTDWRTHFPLASLPCGNENPYSPKCRGPTCPEIRILAGHQGEFYISRVRNLIGLGGTQNYSNHEYAEIYVPYGKLCCRWGGGEGEIVLKKFWNRSVM